MVRVESESSTHVRYKLAIDAFLEHQGARAKSDISRLTSHSIIDFRGWLAQTKTLAPGTINTHLRVVRACLNAASKQGLIERNPAAAVKGVKESREESRKALTGEDIRKILEACGDTEWRGLVLTGLYTGQRISDCATLTWGQVDLVNSSIEFFTRKTGKRISMHLASPLADYLK